MVNIPGLQMVNIIPDRKRCTRIKEEPVSGLPGYSPHSQRRRWSRSERH